MKLDPKKLIFTKEQSDERDRLMSIAYEKAITESGDSEADSDVCYIGMFELDDLPEYVSEDKLGTLNLKGEIKSVIVEIRTNEGWEKPHLHVHNDNFNTAVRLDVCEYFHHYPYDDFFNNKKQAKEFDEFMRSKNYNGMTNWEYAKMVFNNYYGPSGHPLKADEQPDYSELPVSTKKAKR